MARKMVQRKGADTFLELVRECPLRPIYNDQQHEQALNMFTRFARGDQNLDAATVDYLHVLVNLIQEYEKKAGYTLDTSHVTAADLVRHLLGERDMSVSALAKELNIQQADLTKMLNSKREWSKSVIVKLTDYFRIDAKLFLKSA